MELDRAIEEMLAAVNAERDAVRRELGDADRSSLPLPSGFLEFSEPGAYLYVFETDHEQLLADGLRVQVEAPGVLASGEVVDHDPGQGRLRVVLRESLGEGGDVRDALLHFESTFLLDRLAGRLGALRTSLGPEGTGSGDAARRALAFLEGTVAPRPPAALRRERLSASQNAAIAFVVGQEAAYLWGPPGTGKTQTVAHLVHELIGRGERVLLTAHTNIATDTALERVLDEQSLGRRQVVRIGYHGEKLRRLGVGLDDAAEARLRDRDPAVARQLEDFCREVARRSPRPAQVLTAAGVPLPRRFRAARDALGSLTLLDGDDLPKRGADLGVSVEAMEDGAVAEATLVAGTLTRLYTSRLLRDFRTDSVVVDEASIASLVQTFLAASCASRRVVAVGDFMQLPAIVASEQPSARSWLGRHVFASAGCDRAERGHPLRAMLDEQWRMHPQISSVVSRVFYAGRLRDAPAVQERGRARPGPAVVLLDTSRSGATTDTLASGSKRNRHHAELIASLVKQARDVDVAVIAPYRAQVRLLRDTLRESASARLASGKVEAFTVHRFQGRDKSLVVFDLVEAPGTLCRFLDERYNASAPNLLNVALSRARDRLIVVAHLGHLSQGLGRNAVVNRVFAQMRQRGTLELVAGDVHDEARLASFLEGR